MVIIAIYFLLDLESVDGSMLSFRIQEANCHLHPAGSALPVRFTENNMPDLLAFICRFTVFAALHSFFTLQRVQDVLTRRMGHLAGFYRLAYNILALATFGWTMNVYTDSPLLYQFPTSARPIGYLAQGGLFILLCACASQTGFGDFIGIRQLRGRTRSPVIITTGCYAKVRHPQYLLATLFLLVTPSMTVRWLALTLLSVLYFICGAIIEEKRLVELFGEHYRRYQGRVPMFIPWIGKR